jgi:uncharacterized membrane protein (UPF0127 family)
MKLVNKSRNLEVVPVVNIATGFIARGVGLLGKKSLPTGHALWIHGSPLMGCSSIHTHFMRFAIDVVFVDKNLIVKSVHQDLRPWRMTAPISGAASVFEMPSGTLKVNRVEVGDQLYVGD